MNAPIAFCLTGKYAPRMVERIMRNEEWIMRLMDMQKFVRDDKLQSLLDGIGIKYGLYGAPRELQDEELELYAAGDPSFYEHGKTKMEKSQEEDETDDH